MRLASIVLAGTLLAGPAAWAQSPAEMHASYATYAAGMEVAAVDADLLLGPYQYQVQLDYHATGLLGFFNHGRQHDEVDGIWHAGQPEPHAYVATGIWHGTAHRTLIDYRHGDPVVRELEPPDTGRQPVPPNLQAHSVDTLSALALLIRQIARTRACDASVRTFDGRRATELSAHTAGWERLPQTGRSAYSGPALRCDFTSQVLAGFPTGSGGAKDHPPLHGSAWFAAIVPNGPPLPVRLRFETDWFGDAVTYLTAAGPGAPPQVAQQR